MANWITSTPSSTATKYDFFNPNVCQVCKSTEALLKCPSCGLVSYCSSLHKLHHETEHKEICDAIVTHTPYRDFKGFDNTKLQTWGIFKKMNMQFMKQTLNRNLEPYEQQMFLFAKSCGICHIQNDVYIVCSHCHSVNFCHKHLSYIVEHACSQLKLCLQLNTYIFYNLDRSKTIWKDYMCLNIMNVHDMESFIQNCIQHRNCIQHKHGSKYDRIKFIWTVLTDDFSGPLTLLYSMQRAQLLHRLHCNFFVIHIVAGFLPDISSISAWESFLHTCSDPTVLLIVMIGPELEDKYDFVDVCAYCSYKSNLLQYEYRSMNYYTFSKSILAPRVIIGFDIDLRLGNMWRYVIKACQRHGCPLLLTANSNIQANGNITLVQEVLGPHINPLFHEQNKFASQRPHRDYEKDCSVYYPNKYLTFYKDLITPTCAVKKL